MRTQPAFGLLSLNRVWYSREHQLEFSWEANAQFGGGRWHLVGQRRRRSRRRISTGKCKVAWCVSDCADDSPFSGIRYYPSGFLGAVGVPRSCASLPSNEREMYCKASCLFDVWFVSPSPFSASQVLVELGHFPSRIERMGKGQVGSSLSEDTFRGKDAIGSMTQLASGQIEKGSVSFPRAPRVTEVPQGLRQRIMYSIRKEELV